MRSFSLLFLSLGLACANEGELLGFTFSALDGVRLPQPLSDFTISFDETSQLVYIAGGCNAEQGNVFLEDLGSFVCFSSSAALYSFDYRTNSFETLAAMPVARYRHGAALVDGKIWLLGGRETEADALLTTVDVYDIATNEWTSHDLPEEYQTSDNAAFTNGEQAFFAGGYDATYGFKNAVFTVEEDGAGNITIVDKAPLLFARGDHTAVTLPGTPISAYVTGGFGEEAVFCAPLVNVEKYEFETDSWTRVADLNQGRGDKALVVLGEHIFAMGGERPVVGICGLEETPEAGEMTLAVDDLEVYHADDDEWVILVEDLPSHRFRFSAVGYNEIQAIYVFGGQKDYDADCNCFNATDEILVYTEELRDTVEEAPADGTPVASPTGEEDAPTAEETPTDGAPVEDETPVVAPTSSSAMMIPAFAIASYAIFAWLLM